MHPNASCWPTGEQELLLRASLLQGYEAVDAWHQWRAGADIDRLDPGSFRLLPLLYRNLHTHQVEDPWMGKIKGIYRATWYRNQMRFRTAADLLRALHDAGIQTMILKGAALALLYYKDLGLRPMDDWDALVPTQWAPRAIDLLIELGWTPVQRRREAFTEAYFSVLHAHLFRDSTGHSLDLHWHALADGCHANADDDFWQGAVPAKIHDVPTCALNPADELFHTCVHGARWTHVPPFRWLADAMVIIQAAHPEIDWERLAAQARERRLVLPVRDTLEYLRDRLDAPIPQAVLESLRQSPVSRAEQAEYRLITRAQGVLGQLPAKWFRYRRSLWAAGHDVSPIRLAGFLRYLQLFWGLDHLWQLPLLAVRRGVGNILGAVGGHLSRSTRTFSRDERPGTSG